MKMSETLGKAREQIEKRGWAQGSFYNNKGQVCMLGALGCVERHNRDAEVLLEDWFKENVGSPVAPYQAVVPYWNDREETTVEDVLLWLKKAEQDFEELGE